MKAGGPFDEEMKSEAAAPASESTVPAAPATEAPKTEEPVSATVPAEEAKAEAAPVADASDVDQNKPFAIIGYIIPILFFIPMLAEKKSPFGMFHAKQQLNLLLAGIAVNIVGGIIPILGWFIILPIGSIIIIVLAIMGIINAAKGEMKKLPIIGGFQIIK